MSYSVYESLCQVMELVEPSSSESPLPILQYSQQLLKYQLRLKNKQRVSIGRRLARYTAYSLPLLTRLPNTLYIFYVLSHNTSNFDQD